MAFVVTGFTAIYQAEQLPLPTAILIHAAVLHLAYLLFYILNGWNPKNLYTIGIFTDIFTAGFGLIWVII